MEDSGCVYYRHLNHQTVNDHSRLPRIDEIFTDVHDTHCFISIDLLRGNQQIPGRVKGSTKTAFLTNKGLFVLNYMRIRLCNATATVQILMELVFHEHIGNDGAASLDDLLMYAFQYPQLLPVFA